MDMEVVKDHWFPLGVHLGIPFANLKETDHSYKGLDRKIAEMLSKWRRFHKDVSCQSLIVASTRRGKKEIKISIVPVP